MYKKISDYAIIGNLHSIALVGLDGSIDWLCLPHIDSPSVFAALLDDKKGGRFSLAPAGEWDSTASYLQDTNILLTKFRTKTGVMHLTDFMPIPQEARKGEKGGNELYRYVSVIKGTVELGMVFDPRFNYARTDTSLTRKKRMLVVIGENERMTLAVSQDVPESTGDYTAQWTLSEGETLWFRLQYNTEKSFICNTKIGENALNKTKNYWRAWLMRRETGRSVQLGHYQKMVDRSALILKLLQYEETGTIAAAATTSLPENIGGVRNWDYRYTWVRDTSFTLQALFNLGHISETEGYLRWIERLISGHGAARLQIMYGLRGEEKLPEQELTHLDGYKGSKPVRIGNGAARQKQLDIYGEVMEAALKLSDYVGKIDRDMWPFLRAICDHVVEHWREKDSGIWEVRKGPYHFVYSKVMCWVALDRGFTIAHRYGFPAALKTWEKTREEIKQEVLTKGFNEVKRAFVQHYDTDALDASSLLIPLVGFLPHRDPRMLSTIEAIRQELSNDGLLFRYRAEDGLKGNEGTFLLCSFWLINNLIALGKLDEAEHYLTRMEGIANHVGLFSEEYDVKNSEQLGNFPQAFTHIGYINSVIALSRAKGKTVKDKKTLKKDQRRSLRSGVIVLNDGKPEKDIFPKEIVTRLKGSMNILRGGFFDTVQGRVAYEQMYKSHAYEEYVKLSYGLKNINLNELKGRDEKIALWINLYNVIVIHGVIELGIRDSVNEVRNFFRRVQYRIDNMFFCPDDIEHGILRGNRRPPNSFFKLFKVKDKRFGYTIKPIDPRIHFALVCASSSCPPIAVYTAENLDKELSIAGETFLNSGGIILDKEKKHISLSRIFKWYGGDFGRDEAERLRFIAPYLYDEEDRAFLQEYADIIKIDYQEYDWRLNRY
jgi:GH15 family glucan-1,4-alpha-glucosidase